MFSISLPSRVCPSEDSRLAALKSRLNNAEEALADAPAAKLTAVTPATLAW